MDHAVVIGVFRKCVKQTLVIDSAATSRAKPRVHPLKNPNEKHSEHRHMLCGTLADYYEMLRAETNSE